MQATGYIDQSAKDLRFTLALEAVDERQFTLLRRQNFITPWISVTMGVIGESHFLIFRAGNITLSEVFACMEVRTNITPITYGKPRAVEIKIADLGYRFVPRITPWEEGLEALNELHYHALQGCDRGLHCEFPATEDGRVPTTVLVASVKDDVLTVRTAHAYPNEDLIVFTRTMVERR